jgi:hypothetical protein
MEHARLRKPAVSQGEDTLPGERALLASAAECMPPMPYHSFPEYAETVQVPQYRIVVEVALHDRLEPLAGLAHGIVHTLTELLLISRSFAPMRLRIVLRLTVNRPSLFFPLMCLKPRKSNVSGFPSPLRSRWFHLCSVMRRTVIAWLRKLSRRLSQPGFPRYGITAGLPVIRPKCGLTKSVESAIAY